MSHSPHHIEVTQDGSPTLYSEVFGEHYHSLYGARAESQHIFIDHALALHTSPSQSILEVGLGTGLNALLSLLYQLGHPQTSILYTTYELYPLSHEVIQAYAQHLSPSERTLFLSIHEAPWGECVEISTGFRLHKILGDARTLEPPSSPATIVYMDAFSPERCPELWAIEQLQRLYDASASDAYLSTYCAKGAVRRALESVGYIVTRTPGPPGGKREILVCRKP